MNRIPAGISDQNIELFYSPDGMKAFVDGALLGWKDIPASVKTMIRTDLEGRPEAVSLLAHLPADEQLQAYARCRFGAMGTAQPDLTACGQANGEYWCDCQECPLKPALRGKLQAEHGWLSAREIQVIRLIACGMLGKEIASELGISESTLNSHKRAVFEKTGTTTNVELASWAYNINLI